MKTKKEEKKISFWDNLGYKLSGLRMLKEVKVRYSLRNTYKKTVSSITKTTKVKRNIKHVAFSNNQKSDVLERVLYRTYKKGHKKIAEAFLKDNLGRKRIDNQGSIHLSPKIASVAWEPTEYGTWENLTLEEYLEYKDEQRKKEDKKK